MHKGCTKTLTAALQQDFVAALSARSLGLPSLPGHHWGGLRSQVNVLLPCTPVSVTGCCWLTSLSSFCLDMYKSWGEGGAEQWNGLWHPSLCCQEALLSEGKNWVQISPFFFRNDGLQHLSLLRAEPRSHKPHCSWQTHCRNFAGGRLGHCKSQGDGFLWPCWQGADCPYNVRSFMWAPVLNGWQTDS